MATPFVQRDAFQSGSFQHQTYTGIFDTGIFDTGIFDHDPAADSQAAAIPNGAGGKRYWDWIRGRKSLAAHIRGEDVERIRSALTGKKKKRVEQQAEIILRAPARDVAVVKELLPDLQAEVVAELRDRLPKSIVSDEAKLLVAQYRETIEDAYVALLAVREAKARAKADADAEEEADAMELLTTLAQRRRAALAERALMLMERWKLN